MQLLARPSTAQLMVGSFVSMVIIGTLLLKLPFITHAHVPANSWSDALFMSTSAVCVTGLSVRNLDEYTWLGQIAILLLIQIGGIGIITFAKLTLLASERRFEIGDRDLVASTFGSLRWVKPRAVLRQTFLFTLSCELIGTLLLAPPFIHTHGWISGLWAAVFHSVSAFCNAGFGLWSDSLALYRDNLYVNFVIMGLIFSGGIGYIVIADVITWLQRRRTGLAATISLHTRIVLTFSLLLIFGGSAIITIITMYNADGTENRWMETLFLSVTARTAGFSTFSIDSLSPAALLIVMLLMLVGGSPGSTAGGVKTTTLAVLIALIVSRIRGRTEAEIFHRAISFEVVGRSLSVVAAMAISVLIGLIALEITENGWRPMSSGHTHFLHHLFEVVSALATVGLSTGITTQLSDNGRLVIDVCMLAGRLGPLVLAGAFIAASQPKPISYPRENVFVG